VTYYIVVSAVTGIVVGIQNLCFNIVGRKLSNTVRVRLYRGIMVQDVAFFDGNSSGQLTSRISNDVGFMVSPIQTMLGSLVSSSVLLVGEVTLFHADSLPHHPRLLPVELVQKIDVFRYDCVDTSVYRITWLTKE